MAAVVGVHTHGGGGAEETLWAGGGAVPGGRGRQRAVAAWHRCRVQRRAAAADTARHVLAPNAQRATWRAETPAGHLLVGHLLAGHLIRPADAQRASTRCILPTPLPRRCARRAAGWAKAGPALPCAVEKDSACTPAAHAFDVHWYWDILTPKETRAPCATDYRISHRSTNWHPVPDGGCRDQRAAGYGSLGGAGSCHEPCPPYGWKLSATSTH